MRIDVLDHGYVELVEAWGTGKAGVGDERDPLNLELDDYEIGIIEAARQSTQGAFRGWDDDAKLLRYLHEHHHATPFEFSGMVIEVRAPIFVFREWHRHRTQSYNEASARYAPLPAEDYLPDVGNLLERANAAVANRQAQGLKAGLLETEARRWLQLVAVHYDRAEQLYRDALAVGIPKELARITMPLGRYSQMRASANLRNWLAFLTLRLDPAAQWEIRQYANAVGECVAEAFPQTWKLFQGQPA